MSAAIEGITHKYGLSLLVISYNHYVLILVHKGIHHLQRSLKKMTGQQM